VRRTRTRFRLLPICLTTSLTVAAVLFAAPRPARAQPSGYKLQAAFPGVGFVSPLGLATPPGETNRLFVVERAGRIKLLADLSTPGSITFLDISTRVTTAGEEGMLGLAFHPNYASNGFFYVSYTTNIGSLRYQRLSRFRVSTSNPNLADPLSEQVLIEQRDDFSNHQGGDLHFGPDGYLYASLGDEGNANDPTGNAQNITRDFFSALMRIDVDLKPGSLAPNAHPAVKTGTYRVPPDNPFVNATSFNGVPVDPTKIRTEFWAVGFRNPWRFSFDPLNGKLYLGDTGQNSREEIDIVEKGKNYGWAFREGTIATGKLPPPGAVATDPIYDYGRADGGAIIGGIVYRGSHLPELTGAYIYGDYAGGDVWALKGSGPYIASKLVDDSGPVSFGVDPRNGDVLVAFIQSQTVKRLVRQLTPPVISNLVVNDSAITNPPAGADGIANSAQWSIQNNFQANVTAFGDRAFKVTGVPAGSVLLGKAWIRPAADSKNYTGTPLATFTVGGTFVYLAADNRHNTGARPSWLDASYVDQGFDITVTEGNTARSYSVYRKPVTSGSTVALPRIGSATAPCYLVIVQ
jgi:glucose/arabinose dehydrogenase